MVVRRTTIGRGRVDVKINTPRTFVGAGPIQIRGDSPSSIVLNMDVKTASQIYTELAKIFNNTEGKK